jgi:hypothetical protein
MFSKRNIVTAIIRNERKTDKLKERKEKIEIKCDRVFGG